MSLRQLMLTTIQTNYLRIRHGYVSLMEELWLELMILIQALIPLKKTGGAKTVKLTESEMPAHPGHMYTNTGSAWGGNTARYLSSDKLTVYGSAARGWNVYNGNEAQPAGRDQGGSKAHNNLQPYITVYFWKRTA